MDSVVKRRIIESVTKHEGRVKKIHSTKTRRDAIDKVHNFVVAENQIQKAHMSRDDLYDVEYTIRKEVSFS